MRNFARFLCFLLATAALGGGGSQAALSPEQYWRFVLPNTPMPRAISQLLENGDSLPMHSPAGLPKRGDLGQRAYYRRYQRFANESAPPRLEDPSMALFFLERNLQHGRKMTLHFTNLMSGTRFLHQGEAGGGAIPFSSEELPAILDRFGVQPGSDDAAQMRATLLDCEEPANKGEEKACVTSLESMIDFVVSCFGTSSSGAAQAFSTSSPPAMTATTAAAGKEEEYTVASVRRMTGAAGQLVACHPESYVYAVFSCHLTQATRAYTASLVVGGDSGAGAVVEAVAVCHTDTSEWSPEHVSFQMLGVKPGTVPVCHFMHPDAVVWTRSAPDDAA